MSSAPGSGYPRSLLDTANPPLLLYAQGRFELLQADAIAVVGSRNPTPQGADNARAFSNHPSDAGLSVVSGLALGIDAAVHTGGLEGCGEQHRGGRNRAGSRLPAPQPEAGPSHRRARPDRQRVRAGHASATGQFPDAHPHHRGPGTRHAGGRSGTEAGSLITARLANEAGREVFAIPGSIHSPQSRGCHALIKQGAKLVETARDILEELRLPSTTVASGPLADATAPADDPLLTALGFDPVTLDALAARTGRSAAELSSRLLELELDGHVARLPGQLFQRIAAR